VVELPHRASSRPKLDQDLARLLDQGFGFLGDEKVDYASSKQRRGDLVDFMGNEQWASG
jgi:hypothetical protein